MQPLGQPCGTLQLDTSEPDDELVVGVSPQQIFSSYRVPGDVCHQSYDRFFEFVGEFTGVFFQAEADDRGVGVGQERVRNLRAEILQKVFAIARSGRRIVAGGTVDLLDEWLLVRGHGADAKTHIRPELEQITRGQDVHGDSTIVDEGPIAALEILDEVPSVLERNTGRGPADGAVVQPDARGLAPPKNHRGRVESGGPSGESSTRGHSCGGSQIVSPMAAIVGGC